LEIPQKKEKNQRKAIIIGFIGPQILNFERSLSLYPGPQSSFVPPCKISLGGPDPVVCGVAERRDVLLAVIA
jgi:hypothetical protein